MAVLLAPGDGFLADGFGVCQFEKGSDEWVALGTWWEMSTSSVLQSDLAMIRDGLSHGLCYFDGVGYDNEVYSQEKK